MKCPFLKAAKRCLCIPWNFPRMSMKDPPICDNAGTLNKKIKNILNFYFSKSFFCQVMFFSSKAKCA